MILMLASRDGPLGTLAIAIAGGAAGSVLTFLLTVGGRALDARRELPSHDRFVADRDADLASWVSDRTQVLRDEIKRTVDGLAARGAFTSGETNYTIKRLKERALHEYRDQLRQASRDVDVVRESETALHRYWRRRQRRPFPRLTAPQRAEYVLSVWRSSVTRYGGPTDVVDPASRTLETTAQELQSTGSSAFV